MHLLTLIKKFFQLPHKLLLAADVLQHLEVVALLSHEAELKACVLTDFIILLLGDDKLKVRYQEPAEDMFVRS